MKSLLASNQTLRFRKIAFAVLLFTLFVILWGAVVRATGSGAGCGDHWPQCNGEIIPQKPTVATSIEFIHRLTSGLSLILTTWLFVLALRIFPSGHPARLSAITAFICILIEAGVGASLVLNRWVEYDISLGRAIIMPVHLINTIILMSSLTFAWQLADRPFGLRFITAGLWEGAYVLLLITSASGAIAALGDTVFDPATLAKNPVKHLLLDLRNLHPFIAAGTALYCLYVALQATDYPDRRTSLRGYIFAGLITIQILHGLLNIALMAPVYMQISHLALANFVVISLLLTYLELRSRA